WRDLDGNMLPFSVKCAWEVLRPRGLEVSWYNIAWFSYCIPRHAFHLWLVMKRCLKTQDKLRPWDVEPNVDLNLLKCSLCGAQMDSHEHLFFECVFSSKVWNYVRGLAEMDVVPPSLHDIVAYIQPMAKSRMVKNIIGKLLVAASLYFLWIERNNRLFKKGKRSPEEIRDVIMVTVRLKHMTLRFKKSTNASRILERWKMPTTFRLYGS
ncbi:reverse transcriptase domain, reverse transcriptase zinc-binding domain protein, partial [Tanacetum coccineum]